MHSPALEQRSPTTTGRPMARALLLSAWLFGVITVVGDAFVLSRLDMFGFDSHAYWLAGRSAHPYAGAPTTKDAYLYSPVFAQLLRLPALLPWPAFAVGWAAAEAALFVWLTAPLAWRWRIPALMACVPEVMFGNVYAWLALAVVLAVKRPAWWALPLLTKITPGLLGLLWFVARGEWRPLLKAVIATGTISLMSFALEPQLWVDWVRFLVSSGGGDNSLLVVRTLAGMAIVVVGARGTRRWCLPVAMWLSAPVFGHSSKDFAVFAALPRLVSGRSRP